MKLLRPHARNAPEEYNRRWLAWVFRRTVKTEDGCWVWQGFIGRNGYGQHSYRGRGCRVHRHVYKLAKNHDIPSSIDVCHSCDVRACINPDHLWAGTRKQNMRDCSEKGRADRQWMTACEHGHPYDESNLWIDKNGWRKCRTCSRIRQRIASGWSPEEARATGHMPIPQNAPTPRRWQAKRSRLGEVDV